MWSCFKLPNNGRNPTEKESRSLEKKNPEQEQFRFLKGRTDEESFMLENGGRILEELISSFGGKSTPFRNFSKQELQIATNNYAQDGVLHSDLTYKLYKGTLENREISVKWFTKNDAESFIHWYINELAVASQMNHQKHVLKLLGCCLETQVPTLVYEFAENGDLSDHIYEKLEAPSKHHPLLTWDNRLRIATEVADAITYLHKGTSKPIIHREIKPRNIFLGKNFVAKLFEFGLSISIPLGETYVESEVVGSIGFIAPEAFSTGRFTEKTDVYSFGCVLLEILTGRRVNHIFEEVFDGENDTELLVEQNGKDCDTVMKTENDLERYLKANILRERNREQSMACAELALKCVKVNPEGRPTMMKVAYELRRIKGIQPTSQ
ncbi:non-functional pseudokinase ZED1-like [Telopea speciosissima]|uniref:non-functional pseudokinase ZED1-like n=1 Tax=Telopea speciosissima TaxID=54955 RepID=UPI001CC35AF0|nr:non-functional pseudokinase ZED1-like [Telopea speciosissima]